MMGVTLKQKVFYRTSSSRNMKSSLKSACIKVLNVLEKGGTSDAYLLINSEHYRPHGKTNVALFCRPCGTDSFGVWAASADSNSAPYCYSQYF
jgi:hypothetical protein